MFYINISFIFMIPKNIITMIILFMLDLFIINNQHNGYMNHIHA